MNLDALTYFKKHIGVTIVICGLLAFFVINNFAEHSLVGEWEDSSCKMKLSVSKDNSAIYHYAGLGNESCEWAEKGSRLIVLKCNIDGLHDRTLTLTFKSISDDTGFLDGISRGLSDNGFDMHRANQNDVCSTALSPAPGKMPSNITISPELKKLINN